MSRHGTVVARAGLMIVFVALALPVRAVAIPATPLMTLYRFNGAVDVPYYDADDFARRGTRAKVAGSLAQGTSVIPCLILRDGKPLTDDEGTPWVGFEVVIDSRSATPSSAERFAAVRSGRERREVRNHRCPRDVRHVIDVRDLYAMTKPPFFDPPPATRAKSPVRAADELDAIVRSFHDSRHCQHVQEKLLHRRAALASAWSAFARENPGRWSKASLSRARHLDYAMRTALYEGHRERGCNAYGACERNVIALSIRNRARGRCARGQGCRYEGDFEGVASKPSQYNIWDEYLTQVSGLTSCFLRTDLASQERYAKIRAMYAQSRADVEKILFGDDDALAGVFPGTPPAQLKSLRHYYHPPAMGKCFPDRKRIEYISGAIARRGDDFALIANTRIEVGGKRSGGYAFRRISVEETDDRDVVRTLDEYPGFVIDGRKVTLRRSSRCRPYGTPGECRFERVGRHRRTPGWLSAGHPLRLSCRVHSRGESCRGAPRVETPRVGGACDTAMQPVAGVR